MNTKPADKEMAESLRKIRAARQGIVFITAKAPPMPNDGEIKLPMVIDYINMLTR